MKTLAERISKLTGSYREYGHPIDLNWALEPEYLKAAEESPGSRSWSNPFPSFARWSPPAPLTPRCTMLTANCTA